jgi:hypothetical protein
MKPEDTTDVKLLTDRSDVFNYVINHLREQGCQSLFEEKKMCAYRGDGGTMCAVGTLIADDEYSPSLENNSIVALFAKNLLPTDLKKRIEPNLHMLSDLQKLHDNFLEYKDGEFTEDVKAHIDSLRVRWDIK